MNELGIAIKRPGTERVYTLQSKTVTLRGGKQQDILVFAPQSTTSDLSGYRIIESDRYNLSEQQLASLAAALTTLTSCSLDKAVRSVLLVARNLLGVPVNQLPNLRRRIERSLSL